MSQIARITRRKATGAHYTPLPLGRFLARRILRHLGDERSRLLRVLDPACGLGALLDAFERAAREDGRQVCGFVGVEPDEAALESARTRLGHIGSHRLNLVQADYLELSAPAQGEGGLWPVLGRAAHLTGSFDVVIANPPYVRTQVLGAAASRRLAERYDLSGRIDLYQVFLVAATHALREGGILGIILSNRFLSTLTGTAVRRYLASHYEVCEVVDLGDTKLFEAAVLPAVLIARRRPTSPSHTSRSLCRFVRVYSAPVCAGEADSVSPAASVYDLLDEDRDGLYRVPGGVFRVSTGTLDLSRNPGDVWCLTTPSETQWVAEVNRKGAGRFEDLAYVRVGIKTTADSVFIRSDWEALPSQSRPEPAILRPLLSHEDARRWARQTGQPTSSRVLYPHEMRQGRRAAVHLGRFPGARHYLESHAERLRDRRYLADSGRKWYEIWVPQDPSAWAKPKIVFPDISPEPRFFLDRSGALVNGDCYWLSLRPDCPEEILYLLLGLANSALMRRYHDLAFGNRLYAGRRRYITQYVARYPYPDPSTRAARKIVEVAKELVEAATAGDTHGSLDRLESRINGLARECFAMDSDGTGRS